MAKGKSGPTKKAASQNPAKEVSAPTKAGETCFVIMPFGGYFDTYYESIFKPAIEAAGLEPHRADDLYRPSGIVNDIWAYTQDAKVILADLTTRNPNVFYELGLAHAIAKPVVMVTQTIEDVPFDLRGLRIITYDKNIPDWGEVLQQKIVRSLKEVLGAPEQAVPSIYLKVRPDAGQGMVTEHDKELIEIRQEIEQIKRGMTPAARSRRMSDPALYYGRAGASGIGMDSMVQYARTYLLAGGTENYVRDRLKRDFQLTGYDADVTIALALESLPPPPAATTDTGDAVDLTDPDNQAV